MYFIALKNAIQCLQVADAFFFDQWELPKVGDVCFFGAMVSPSLGTMSRMEKGLHKCGLN